MNKPEELKKLEDLKQMYENIEIPAELSQVVSHALKMGSSQEINHQKSEVTTSNTQIDQTKGVIIMNTEKINEQNRKNHTTGRKRLYRTAGTVAAAMAICVGAFAYGVTSNEAFATSMRGVPVLGSLVQVFTGESVNNMDDVCEVKMALPKVEGLTDKTVEDRINKEIEQKMNAVVDEAKIRMAENKKAYLETGGTEEEYKQRIPEIVVDYEVKSVTDQYLSFLVSKTETSASAYFEQYYYNIDLKTNKEVTLKDLLGKDYINVANGQILPQIEERSKQDGAIYWGFNDDTDFAEKFQTIQEDQKFYINDAGHAVIVFNKYEISPGFMGIQEFEVAPLK